MATLPDSVGLITSTDDPLSLEGFERALASIFRGVRWRLLPGIF